MNKVFRKSTFMAVCPRRVDNHGYLPYGGGPCFRAGHNGKPQS